MLVVTRKVDERLRLLLPDGSVIWVMICRVSGEGVRVGIDAPPDVRIEREEIIKDAPHDAVGA